ncbi:hypothetical protein [Paraburkholderia sp. SIMBA_054]|uniref:hypothetical protein n=1 Tax=Paraburkholderia sp. SIMBA_054 TaxID=3085795 RepID=UPI0039797D02
MHLLDYQTMTPGPIDPHLRQALHSIYRAQFDAIHSHPEGFTAGDATRMLTHLMGSREWSWPVRGITPAALEVFAVHGFRPPPGQLQRGHRYDRRATAQALYFERAEAASEAEFFEFFLARDETVIMTREQNRAQPGAEFPPYIPIDASLGLFRCAPVVGWRHGAREKAFLRELHDAHRENAEIIVLRTGR